MLRCPNNLIFGWDFWDFCYPPLSIEVYAVSVIKIIIILSAYLISVLYTICRWDFVIHGVIHQILGLSLVKKFMVRTFSTKKSKSKHYAVNPIFRIFKVDFISPGKKWTRISVLFFCNLEQPSKVGLTA